MGTRGLLGFIADKELRVAYNHWDSYPSGLGVEVLSYARQIVKDGALSEVKARVGQLKVIDDSKPPTPEDIEALEPWTDLSVSERSTQDWYCLTRRTQGNPDAILTSGYISDDRSYLTDSIGIEWTYLLDLDAGALLVWDGAPGAYPDNRPPTATFPFSDLPTDDAFVARLES